jgi:hypothetical protein
MRNVNSRMNGTRIGIKIVTDAHPRAILGHLGMTRKMSGTKMTGTLNAGLRTTLNLGFLERSGIN